MSNYEIGIVKNIDDVDVDVDAVINRIQDTHELYFNTSDIKNTLTKFTRDDTIWYGIFVAVSQAQFNNKNSDSRNNSLGNYEDIRDRLVIENIELMMDTIKSECDRDEYDDNGNLIIK